MSKNDKQKSKDLLRTLPFGKYSELFELLTKGETRNLTDAESSKHSFMPVRANDEMVFLTESDRYSNKSQIICSPGSPVPFPFHTSVM